MRLEIAGNVQRKDRNGRSSDNLSNKLSFKGLSMQFAKIQKSH